MNKENRHYYQVIERYRARIKPENRQFVSKNLQISEQISTMLYRKGWSQKEFAIRMGKQESEISKWLSGLHNLTLKSITHMETVLGEDILITPTEECRKYETIKYVPLWITAKINHASKTFPDPEVTEAKFKENRTTKAA